MTEQETRKILSMISEIYPSFRKDRIAGIVLEIWSTVLKDSHFVDVNDALMQYIARDTRGFPPLPGVLLEIVSDITQWDEVPGILTACRLIRRAVRHGPEYAEEEFRALPPMVRNLLGSPKVLRTWASLDPPKQESAMDRFSKKLETLCLENSTAALPAPEAPEAGRGDQDSPDST